MDVIQGLWIGSTLSVMEQLSMRSFISAGHAYHLYTYENVIGVPEGVTVLEAREILPESRIFTYVNGSYAGFSNYFRYKLLLERGGWWADTDVICLKEWNFDREHVFARELAQSGEVLTSGILKAPIGSKAMAKAWHRCDETDTENLQWGRTGPALVGEVVETCEMEATVEPASTFCPIAYYDWERVLDPAWSGPGDAFGIHLWNEMWRRSGRDKNGTYDSTCFYERLKKRFL